jgi:hypothetical protein
MILSQLDIHTNFDADGHFEGETKELVGRLDELYGNFGEIEGTQMQYSFMDFCDNDCRYYTHVRNSMIAKRLGKKFVENGDGDLSDVGLKFRKAVMEPGLTKDAEAMIGDFLGDDSEGDIKHWIEA